MAGRDEEFTAFVAARSPDLLRLARLLSGRAGAGDDLLQEALVATYRAWPRLGEAGAAEAYTRRTMVNRNISWWRRDRNRPMPMPDGAADTSAAEATAARGLGADPFAQVTERLTLWPVIRQLPPRQRTAIVLRYYENLTEAETAVVMGCSIGTVKSTTARAIAACRKAFQAMQEVPR